MPNPRRAKMHRSYTVEEVARLYGLHRNTVRQWIKRGLPTCDGTRPVLILGGELRDYLTRERTARKHPCKPGEMYCLRCRESRRPALDMADYQPMTATSGNLVGLCPACEGLMFRRTSLAGLAVAAGVLVVTHTQAREHIGESRTPSLNSDFVVGA